MATKADKKNAIRQGIIDSADIYSQSLAGKTFLYVYGEEFFEVSFPIDHFLHLTGVETKLSAKDFYKNAKKAKLTSSQFYFDARHPYANARKKLPCLKRLPELTNDMVCILKEMQTVTIIYKLSVTNLEFTLGLTENTDVNGKKINDFFLPISLPISGIHSTFLRILLKSYIPCVFLQKCVKTPLSLYSIERILSIKFFLETNTFSPTIFHTLFRTKKAPVS